MRDLQLADGTVVPQSLLRFTTSRSGGPGGQNVNKVESRVTVEVDVDALPHADRIRERLATRITREGVLRVTSQVARSQIENRDLVITRLEEMLNDALRERKPRKKTRVSKAAKQKRLEEKKRTGEKKKLRGRVD